MFLPLGKVQIFNIVQLKSAETIKSSSIFMISKLSFQKNSSKKYVISRLKTSFKLIRRTICAYYVIFVRIFLIFEILKRIIVSLVIFAVDLGVQNVSKKDIKE